MALEFEWDSAKADANLKEHGVSFDEATTVFRDALSITILDPDHSDSEDRFIDIGMFHGLAYSPLLSRMSLGRRESCHETHLNDYRRKRCAE